MARRLAAVSALVLAALALSPAARAQGFFSFAEPSPRDVLSRLDDQGYSARLPMTRRGDIYIVDARTSSGRMVRLIVSARDGDILERYAATPRYEDYGRSRWSDEDPYRRHDDEPVDRPERRLQSASQDPSEPRVLNFDGGDKMVPPAAIPDAGASSRTHRHVVRKPVAPSVAKDTPEPAVAAVAPSDPRSSAPKVIEVAPPAKSVVAPVKPEVKIAPAPATQANVEPPKPRTPRIVGEPISNALPKAEDKKVEDSPAPKAVPAEVRAEEKPKPEAPRKKLNDLPVGTLD